MIRKKRSFKRQEQIWATVNRQIRYPEVRVLNETGEMLGVMPTSQALERAQAEEKDLILITPNAKPPVCKIIDLAKYKYQMQQKRADDRKSAHKQEIKEVRLTPFMSDNDLQIRIKKVTEFLERGDKVRLSVEFKGGRQITKKDFGFELCDKVFAAVADISSIEMEPKQMGKKIIAQIMPKKKAK